VNKDCPHGGSEEAKAEERVPSSKFMSEPFHLV